MPVTAFAIHNFKHGHGAEPRHARRRRRVDRVGRASQSRPRPAPAAARWSTCRSAAPTSSSCDAERVHTVAGGGTGSRRRRRCSGTDSSQRVRRRTSARSRPARRAWWGVAVLFDADGNAATATPAWSTFLAGTQPPTSCYDDILAEWEAWRTPPRRRAVRDRDRDLAPGRDGAAHGPDPGAVVGQRRAARTHGMILASLPPGEWHTGWVRDAHVRDRRARAHRPRRPREGRARLLPERRRRPLRQLRRQRRRTGSRVVRYFGDGEEEADYSGQPTPQHRDRRLGPVPVGRAHLRRRDAATSAGCRETTKKGDTVYDAIKNGVAEPLDREPRADRAWRSPTRRSGRSTGATASTSSYTTAAAARGFCDMATLARRAGKMDDVARYKMHRGEGADGADGELRRHRSTCSPARSSGSRRARTITTARRSRRSTWSLARAGTTRSRRATLDGMSLPGRRRRAATSGSRARPTSTTPTSGS